MTTIRDRVELTGGRSTGFDYLRVWLAVGIIVLHSYFVASGSASSDVLFLSPARPFLRFLMPAFFALSGFLVAGSLVRSKTLGMFLGLRVIRIYPALAVETLLSAFILGPIVTTLPLEDYFGEDAFYAYMWNIIGHVHFFLPGVFETNPLPRIVNFQLWTIPFELYSYVAIAIATLVGLKKHRIISVIGIFVVTIGYLAMTLIRHHGELVPVVGALNGFILVATFMAGAAVYFYQDRIPFSSWGAAIAAVVVAILLGVMPGGDFLSPIPVAYLTVWIGLQNPSKKYLWGADYSYGIYLYGFAIQQTVEHFLPAGPYWYFNLLVSLPLSFAIAAVSWHFIEKPALNARTLLKKWEEGYLAFKQGKHPLKAKADKTTSIEP